MISATPWTVREGRSTRYLYVVNAQNEKIAELDLWTATAEDAVLMANAPYLLASLKRFADIGAHASVDDLMEARDRMEAAERPFVQEYKPAVSAE